MSDLVKQMEKPAFLVEAEIEGMEEVKKHLVPSVIRIVQKMSSEELLSRFAVGQVVLLPEQIALADHEDSVTFIPVYFYTEYCTWNPRSTRGSEPAIRARSFDPNSDVGIKARNPDTWEEVHPDNAKEVINHREHLNYMVVVQHKFAPPVPCVISFSSTQHMAGKQFSNLIAARNASIYAGKYELKTVKQSNAKGDWYGFDISNAGWCDEGEHDLMQTLHHEIKEKQIVTDYAEPTEASESTDY